MLQDKFHHHKVQHLPGEEYVADSRFFSRGGLEDCPLGDGLIKPQGGSWCLCKELALSQLWHRFDVWSGSFSCCQRTAHPPQKKKPPQEGSFLGHPVFTGLLYTWWLQPTGVPTWTLCHRLFSLHSPTPPFSL